VPFVFPATLSGRFLFFLLPWHHVFVCVHAHARLFLSFGVPNPFVFVSLCRVDVTSIGACCPAAAPPVFCACLVHANRQLKKGFRFGVGRKDGKRVKKAKAERETAKGVGKGGETPPFYLSIHSRSNCASPTTLPTSLPKTSCRKGAEETYCEQKACRAFPKQQETPRRPRPDGDASSLRIRNNSVSLDTRG
jgi:hypothetical protein